MQKNLRSAMSVIVLPIDIKLLCVFSKNDMNASKSKPMASVVGLSMLCTVSLHKVMFCSYFSVSTVKIVAILYAQKW